MQYQHIGSMLFRFVSRMTDGQTDRQNIDPQDRASIAASRSKNHTNVERYINYSYTPLHPVSNVPSATLTDVLNRLNDLKSVFVYNSR